MEYVLLATAVIAVIIVMVTNKNTGLQAQMNTTLNTAIEQVGTMSDRLVNSQQTTLNTTGTPKYTVNVNPS